MQRALCPTNPLLAIRILLRFANLPQPAPAQQAPAGRVEQAEIVAVADARHVAVQAAAAEEGGLEVVGAGDAAQVVFVEGVEGEGRGGGEDGEDYGLRAGVVAGVGFV